MPTGCGRPVGWTDMPRAVSDEREEALVLFVACWAALEMFVHTRDLLVGVSVGKLELNVAVELVEAPLAGQLGPRRSEEPGEEKAGIGAVGWNHENGYPCTADAQSAGAVSRPRSMCRPVWTAL